MASTLDEVVEAADLQLHPATRQDAPPAMRAAALHEELAWAVEEATTDLDFARDYQHYMPHAGTTAEDYLNRWVTIAPDLEVLLGPRHRARDLSRPFIAVDAASRRIERADLPALRSACFDEFPLFGARSVVFWDWEHPAHWPGTTTDARLLVGRIDSMRDRPLPADLSVGPARDMAFYDRYRAGYADLFEAQPEAREWTRLKEFGVLEASQQQGLLLEARLDDRWTGLIAGRLGTRAGIRGVEVVEIFLLPRYRGRKAGAALSTALAHHVPLPGTDFVFGTVHWENQAARAAARAAGRDDRGGEVVLPL